MSVLPERKICRDCGEVIPGVAFHTGHEKWCEACFDKGLSLDMNDHFKRNIDSELMDIMIQRYRHLKPEFRHKVIELVDCLTEIQEKDKEESKNFGGGVK